MSGPAPVDLLFLWHHHQPDYRDPADGRARLPWVRLHAVKDYLDMALHLERHPSLKATFNFVPSLVDQLEDAVAGRPDELFDVLAKPPGALTPDQRRQLAWRCAMVPPHALDRWPSLRTTIETARRAAANGGSAPGVWLALEVGFLLAWLDPTQLDEPEARRALDARARLQDVHRDDLLALHRRLTSEVLPAYRRLAERGQIELSATPYYHPILPLVIDVREARRPQPELPLPAEPFAAPEDARAQIERALERHARSFGRAPDGMWPSEGSVSPETAALAAACGVRWLASDEGVLWRSLADSERRRAALYQPWTLATPSGDLSLFFRDRELSDRIGFVYQRWDPGDAARDFVARLRRIGEEYAGAAPPLVPVILDGENCWEGYADDGGPFLEALYGELEHMPGLRTVTPGEALAERPPHAAARLKSLHSGSWIDADFHIWIGHPEKNRGWDLLARARRALTESGATRASAPAAWESLARAEGSDWFWWYGEDHFTADKLLFDELFRSHVRGVYAGAGLPAPAALDVPIARPRDPRVHLRPLGFVRAVIDGRRTHFYEWYAAGRVVLGAGGGAMHRGNGTPARELLYGFDAERFLVRLDPPAGGFDAALGVRLEFQAPAGLRVTVPSLRAGRPPVLASDGRPLANAQCAVDGIFELAVPFTSLGLASGQNVELLIQLVAGDAPVATLPPDDVLRFDVPGPDYEARMWSA